MGSTFLFLVFPSSVCAFWYMGLTICKGLAFCIEWWGRGKKQGCKRRNNGVRG
jgi:hypothetical protein